MTPIIQQNGYVKLYFLGVIFASSLLGCQILPSSNAHPADQQPLTQKKPDKKAATKIAGLYIEPSHPVIDNQYQGMVVEVSTNGILVPAKNINITIGTQGDTTPACRYQATASLMGHDALHGVVYTAPVNAADTQGDTEGLVFFRFKDNLLSIDSNNPNAFTQYCTQGASVKGDFRRLK